MPSPVDVAKHIDSAMDIIIDAQAQNRGTPQVAELFVVDGQAADPFTGDFVNNVVLNFEVTFLISNARDSERNIVPETQQQLRLHVSREQLVNGGLAIDEFDGQDLTLESYFIIKGARYNIIDPKGRTGNVYITFFIEKA